MVIDINSTSRVFNSKSLAFGGVLGKTNFFAKKVASLGRVHSKRPVKNVQPN